MFILPNLPSPQAGAHELADFAELLSLIRGTVSCREIVAYLNRLDDNDNNVGCNDDDDENAELLEESMDEIDRRRVACGSGYPFELVRAGSVVRFAENGRTPRSRVYLYLLLSTRLNMLKARNHAGIDGTCLLEELAVEALRNYFGKDRAAAMVFGTSAKGTFPDKVNILCEQLCEGSHFSPLDDSPVTANDDKLDTVAWLPFADRLPGQLVVFAQCKTGTTWGSLVSQLHPVHFIKKWMHRPLVVDPIRALCVSESHNRARWNSVNVEAGILFDRCRLVDCCDEIDSGLLKRIEDWSQAAIASIKSSVNWNKSSK